MYKTIINKVGDVQVHWLEQALENGERGLFLGLVFDKNMRCINGTEGFLVEEAGIPVAQEALLG